MFLKFHPLQTPQVYKFRDPDVRTKTYQANSMPALLALIKGYREQNELPPIEYLETVVENYLCHLPEHKGACLPTKPLKRGLMAAIKGGVALIKSMLYNSYVDQEVADKRSEICSACPHNVFPDKGPFIKWADEMAELSVGNRKSKYHDSIGNCNICSCPLRAKVFYDGPLEFPSRQMKKFPEFCWQKQEAIKQANDRR